MTLTAPERTETKRWLDQQGYKMDVIDNHTEKVQWYKADGTLLAGLLPSDPYHMKLYRAKGWRLTRYSEEQVEEMHNRDVKLFKGQAIEPVEEPAAPLYVSDKPSRAPRKLGRPRKTPVGGK